ncbi:hypothetical protein CAOG_02737 [Capsaspora owczarzaki ATCC 30864]|uniref:Uncharacterized protein n=1 Tax=Capsaspora owczarzaki (strain ATCC 30864) TaxID=595528 RepID=A0A0D2X1Y6_CAPO3|nr:hypothetical protein CAOG_02737 [Capsaspora owczarzaki ATCC 30864]KJE91624.1 hypothetical protein CAOG_002737 [Capsaspora owczarzaki ATCC 30864]|eukprot:XP_004349487.1 hypothetical protein CAOG_02737 [Capsaspora owczarzaki ATCC 30864]
MLLLGAGSGNLTDLRPWPRISPVTIEFLDRTAGRDKLYRTLQYATRLVQWAASEDVVLRLHQAGWIQKRNDDAQHGKLAPAAARQPSHPGEASETSSSATKMGSESSASGRGRQQPANGSRLAPSSSASAAASAASSSGPNTTTTALAPAPHRTTPWDDSTERWRLRVIQAAKQLEQSVSQGRRLFRLLKVLNMYQVFVSYSDQKPLVFVLKQLRTLIYAAYFVLDNIVWASSSGLYTLAPEKRVRIGSLSSETWLITTVLSFVIDLITHQTTVDSLLRHLADFPMAFTLVRGIRLGDGWIGVLGLISSLAGCHAEVTKARRDLSSRKLSR